MDNIYIKENYTNQWKRKSNNAKISNNMEMETINNKGKEKIAYIVKGSNTWHKIIPEHEI